MAKHVKLRTPLAKLFWMGREELNHEHRNIYYRLYTKEGRLESNNPIFSNDRFISHILSKSVRPPHTAASLKRYVCKIEGMEGSGKGAFKYLLLSEKKPLDDSARLALRENSGPGSSEVDPVVLVVDKGPAAEKKLKSASNAGSNRLSVWKIEQCFVHYRLYDDDGKAVSKMSFDESNSSLGRIDIFTIPPPQTVASLKDHLAHVEGVSGHHVQLLENEDGEVTLSDGDAIALLTDDFPGSKEGQPIVFTYAQSASDKMENPSFSKRLTGISNWAGATVDATWHSIVIGEIFQTDGLHEIKPFQSGSHRYVDFPCYVRINSSGNKACTLTDQK
ncbi:uncharacterized protein LACBIDRAFT_314536 [Laccaria bicolor S238N-H82]|uniref:Predicted protein n=1 Tax=Laccaria bicolor (strain S238N-H82 / ATCC MYA-4686) TaxID=486041 RepID=B0DUA8_LACBS|nr:uncharacterized protein LACBIDRAFT_310424 [Laccaria bicolor S238N-H82]XP_001889049.1 uncharacterized protein LACBIDRAFT_314536 [Laccaria bicolor S238N-H82]EDR00297.1 predicted protein [Laccaria bicolor S238N-H82]EDR01712.1 predicted protein [Laccaria bicolor S238N-H82]|eukprot:XP_001887525.1 predicted protein [Laccaria bicolor S238N-H82]